MIEDAALTLLAVADDSGQGLIDVIAEAERFLVEETKVGDARAVKIPKGRRGYTLIDGRLVEVTPSRRNETNKLLKAVGRRR
jgi:hypothetical protein